MSPIYHQLQQIQTALQQQAWPTFDAYCMTLYQTLQDDPVLLPAWVYAQCCQVFRYYARERLPQATFTDHDRGVLQQTLEHLFGRLTRHQQHVHHLAENLTALFGRLKARTVQPAEVLQHFQHILVATIADDAPLVAPSTPSAQFRSAWQTFRTQPFTWTHVRPMGEALLQHGGATAALLAPLFWDQLHNLLHMSAILVDSLQGVATLTRLEVATQIAGPGPDTFHFEHPVEDRMDASGWQAVQAARQFFTTQMPNRLDKQSLHVTARFANPLARYRDTSASLLIGLKVIGDVLDLEIRTDVVVSGALAATGQVEPVEHVPAKVAALAAQPGIQQMLLPAARPVSAPPHLNVTPVNTLTEAAEVYYGAPLQKICRQHNRRQFLKGAVALAVAAPMGLLTFRNVFTHPVTEHDLRLLECARELYQQKSDYQSAITILDAVLARFQSENSDADALQLKAQAYGHLGRIYGQQNELPKGISTYQHALACWKNLHDRERQADILLYLGIAYADQSMLTGDQPYREHALTCYRQTQELIDPGMSSFQRLQGNLALWTGVLYYYGAEHDLAQTYVKQGAAYFTDANALWNYQLSQQFLGNILVRLGQYDQAFELLQATLTHPLLQNPFNQAKSLTGLCDLSFAIDQPSKGRQYAQQARKLCQQHDLQIQFLLLQRIGARHNVSLSSRSSVKSS